MTVNSRALKGQCWRTLCTFNGAKMINDKCRVSIVTGGGRIYRKIDTEYQGQIEYRSGIENWRILWVTSPGDSTALSQCSYIWPAEIRNLHSQTFILEIMPSMRVLICPHWRTDASTRIIFLPVAVPAGSYLVQVGGTRTEHLLRLPQTCLQTIQNRFQSWLDREWLRLSEREIVW